MCNFFFTLRRVAVGYLLISPSSLLFLLLHQMSGQLATHPTTSIHSFDYNFFFFFKTTPAAYGSSQVGIETELQLPASHSHSHSHSNARSKLHLQLTLQLAAMLDPHSTEWGLGSNLHPHGDCIEFLVCCATMGTLTNSWASSVCQVQTSEWVPPSILHPKHLACLTLIQASENSNPYFSWLSHRWRSWGSRE